MANDLKVGDRVVVKGYRADYDGTIGVLYSVGSSSACMNLEQLPEGSLLTLSAGTCLGFPVENLERVRLTDEELVAKFREVYDQLEPIYADILSRGLTAHHRSNQRPFYQAPPRTSFTLDWQFKKTVTREVVKTVTETEEIIL